MSNKRGQFFALWLVVLTLVMSAIVLAMYFVDSKNVSISIISPELVLKQSDDAWRFSEYEKDLLVESASVDGVWGEETFLILFKDNFCTKFSEHEFVTTWFFENVSYGGVDFYSDDVFNEISERKNFCNSIYSFSISGSEIIVSRTGVDHFARLKAPDSSSLSFPMDFRFSLDKQYLISNVGNKISVREFDGA